MARSAIAFRRLGQNCKKRHFVQFEIGHIFVEIGLRCGLNAKATSAQWNFVEIELQDLLFRKHAFDPRREDHFLELAGD